MTRQHERRRAKSHALTREMRERARRKERVRRDRSLRLEAERRRAATVHLDPGLGVGELMSAVTELAREVGGLDGAGRALDRATEAWEAGVAGELTEEGVIEELRGALASLERWRRR